MMHFHHAEVRIRVKPAALSYSCSLDGLEELLKIQSITNMCTTPCMRTYTCGLKEQVQVFSRNLLFLCPGFDSCPDSKLAPPPH
jgi:hypothetical protein